MNMYGYLILKLISNNNIMWEFNKKNQTEILELVFVFEK